MPVRHIVMFSLLLLIGISDAAAQGREKESRLERSPFPRLAYVDLDAELGLGYEMLRGFGLKVDEARREANPAALAAHAVALAFVEEYSGRKAQTISSVDIIREAAAIAEEKESTQAMDAVILAARKISGAETIREELENARKLMASMRGAGNFIAYVKIANRSDRLLDIYIDGNYVGYLYADESYTYSTGNGTTKARVNDAFGNTSSEIFYLEPEETFTWTIQP